MEILYAKYNRIRNTGFQTVTIIARQDGKKVAIKKALTPDAGEHIRNMCEGHLKLKENIVEARIKLPEILDSKEDELVYEFIEGQSFDKILLDAFLRKDKDAVLQLLDEYNELINNSFKTIGDFNLNLVPSIFKGLDMEPLMGSRKSFNEVSFIDPIFDNIVLKDGYYYFIDTEWVFKGNLPVSYILYRSIYIFYLRCRDFAIENLFPFEDLLGRYNISLEIAELFYKMESAFQQFVHGPDRLYDIKLAYLKKSLNLNVMIGEKDNRIGSLEEAVRWKDGHIENLETYVRNLEEAVRWKDDHIGNLETHIKDLGKIIGEKDINNTNLKSLLRERETVLNNIYKSRGWKALSIYYRLKHKILHG